MQLLFIKKSFSEEEHLCFILPLHKEKDTTKFPRICKHSDLGKEFGCEAKQNTSEKNYSIARVTKMLERIK